MSARLASNRSGGREITWAPKACAAAVYFCGATPGGRVIGQSTRDGGEPALSRRNNRT